jgi:hypothetical protein
MAINKKIRFEVFKRDGFKCAYCGNCPPKVILEVDHIDPKSKGGKDDINNLVTSCFDCNRGKKNIPLSKIPPKLSENLEVLQEQEEQIKAYRKFIKKIELRIKKDMDSVDSVYQQQYEKWMFSDQFRNGTLKQFISKLPVNEVVDALKIAISRFPEDKDRVINYFCGICWNKIKAPMDPAYLIKKELIRYWKNQPRGSGYMGIGCLDKWLKEYDVDCIKQAMDLARGIWRDLVDQLGE